MKLSTPDGSEILFVAAGLSMHGVLPTLFAIDAGGTVWSADLAELKAGAGLRRVGPLFEEKPA